MSETLGHWRPRFWVSGIDPNDLEILLSSITDWNDWYIAWAQMGKAHEELGDEAVANGHIVTAAEAYVRAAMYYHFGQFMFFHQPARKEEGVRRRVELYRKAAPYLSPPATEVQIPFEGGFIPGYLRLANSGEQGPCVIMLPGADSAKEQLYAFENVLLARGLSTLGIDGPGQGITRYTMSMRPDYDKAVTAAVDFLSGVPSVDSSRLAVCGTSFGGHLAVRSAAAETRLKASVTVGGFYDLSGWEGFSDLMKNNLTFLFGKSDWSEAAEFAKGFTLEGLVGRVKCPLLVIHGKKDRIFPTEGAYRIAQEATSPVTLKVFEEGNHVCNNIPYRYRPLVADWIKDTLK
ncbi:hypothetical protein SY88_12465 [Clostridiales bacterium PH28_bin88]|nr:hypothetical protein SY88_12465 [Clostridiales bacterium PH28_bin88]